MTVSIIASEWANFLIRWVHVIAGIAWIGSSFYFVHLDLSLRKHDKLGAGIGGEAWQVHGGGFYNMVKYVVAPPHLPKELTWFKWEAYATWISGMAMLIVLYYTQAELYLIDRTVLDISPAVAISISVAGLALGWVIYDLMCKSPLGRNDALLGAVGFVLLVALSYGFTKVFSGRGAYIQIGAMIGTIMVASVAMTIIPNQRKIVTSLLKGETPDPRLGAAGKQRSVHNNYLTLPVVFLMISNHYPLAFASRWNWLIIALVVVIGVTVRHFYNSRHAHKPSPWWTWLVAAAAFLAIVFLSAQPMLTQKAAATPSPAGVQKAAFSDVQDIVISRCSMCHAAEPVWDGVGVAPKGVMLETPEQIRLHAHAIWLQAVATRAMPPGGNITEISDEDRGVIAAWVQAGAPGP
ncbi:MAG: urate hydroxylase PuuD [Beijerinckiaceae bacterium]|nr:urate hydroxylase PuuD [Beijerinckiaceae bacterium]